VGTQGIRQRIILLFSGAAVLVALLLSLTLYLSLRQADQSRLNAERDFSQALRSLMELRQETAESWVRDYTIWDELFDFVASADPAWARLNLESTLQSFKVDHIWILDKRGKLIYHVAKEGRGAPKLALPPVSAARIQSMQLSQGLYGYTSGLWVDSMEVLEIVAMPIQHSDDFERAGPYNGYMVTGAHLDSAAVKKLGGHLGGEIQLYYTTPSAPPFNEAQIELLLPLPPIEGNAGESGALMARRNIESIWQLKLAAFAVYGLSITALLLLSAMLYWLIGRWVIKPLQAFSLALSNNSVEPLFQYIEHSNEIGRLAHLVIEFFRQRQLLNDGYQQQEQHLSELQENNDSLAEAAYTDKLTGIANRRRFDEYLEATWHHNDWLGMILIDIDYFKLYNDTYGHPQGDSCLQRVAQLIAGVVLKQGDLLTRYGGEEFAVLLPSTDERGVFALAQRIHDAVSDDHIPHKTSRTTQHITISVGVAAIKSTPGRNRDVLLAKADLALYQAKANGRDRVERASTLQASPSLSISPFPDQARQAPSRL
jgi:diguanylate cyclase (GGDEF)-like protein